MWDPKPVYLKAPLGPFGLVFLFLRHGLHTWASRQQAGNINKSSGPGGTGPTVVRSSDVSRGAPKSKTLVNVFLNLYTPR